MIPEIPTRDAGRSRALRPLLVNRIALGGVHLIDLGKIPRMSASALIASTRDGNPEPCTLHIKRDLNRVDGFGRR
jgi:hypothetical protein